MTQVRHFQDPILQWAIAKLFRLDQFEPFRTLIGRDQPSSFDLIFAHGGLPLPVKGIPIVPYYVAVQSLLFALDRSDVRILYAAPVSPTLPA